MTEPIPGSGEAADRADVWQRMLTIYAAASRGDHNAADAVIHPEATFFDTDEEPLIVGHDELSAARARRPQTDGDPFSIEASDPRVDIFGSTAVLRHRFVLSRPGSDDTSVVRNTSVWRRSAEGAPWLLVHNHEDVL
ncbi:MAG: YybH family protein [Mycetocola sp.]